MRNLLQDVRFASRKLRQTLGSSLAAVLILGLASGTNAAIYTLADNYYVGDVSNAARGVVLVGARFRDPALDYFFMYDIRLVEPLEQNLRSFETLSRVAPYELTLTNVERPLRGEGLRVGPGFHDVLAMEVLRGRSFAAHDFEPGAEKVTMLANRVWSTAFGSREDIVGQVVGLNGVMHRVIGIYPDSFDFEHTRYEAVSASSYREPVFSGIGPNVWMAGRLREGVTIAQAISEVKGLEGPLATMAPSEYFEQYTLSVRRAGERSHTISQRQLGVLLTAGTIILLIAALNLCSAALVQLNRRRSESATRLALGAGRWDLVKLFTIETGITVLCGFALGVAVGYALVHVVRSQFTGAARGLLALLKPEDIHLNWRILALTFLACLLVLASIGLAAFAFSSAARLATYLKDETRSLSGSRAVKWASSTLLFLQIAATCGLMVVGGFFLASVNRSLSYDFGYSFDGLVRASVFLPYYRFEGREAAPELVPMMESLAGAIRQVPGVAEARYTKLAFPHWGDRQGVRVEHTRPDVAEDNLPHAREGIVGPGFLEMIGVRTLAGELFSPARNRPDAERVIVVNQAFVEEYFGGRDPLDRFVEVRRRRYRVIGVVSDIRRWQIGSGRSQGVALDAPEPVMYFQNAQAGGRSTAYLYVKTRDWNAALDQRIRDAARKVDPDIVIGAFGDLRAGLARAENTLRLLVFTQALVAGIGSLLSCLAIYAAVTYWVTQRRREIGIRLALGARPDTIGGGVVWYTARLVGPAVVAGAGLTYVALVYVGFLGGQLHLVNIGDPRMYLYSGTMLALVGIAASLHPAFRAASLAPNEVLREG